MTQHRQKTPPQHPYLTFPGMFRILLLLLFVGSAIVLRWEFKSLQDIAPKQNETLVIIIGNLRGGEQPWNSLLTNVLDPGSADLALCIGNFSENDHNVTNSSLYKRAKYVWTFEEYEDWGDAVDLINGTSWRSTLLPMHKYTSGVFGGANGLPSSGALLSMIRWFLSHYIKELNLTEKYRRFVITRSDHYYECMHNVADYKVGNNIVWVPKGEHYGGYTDRHMIVGSEAVLDAIDLYPTYFSTPSIQKEKNLNIEQLIKYVWQEKKMKVKYFYRTFFTVRRKTDMTRWSQGSGTVPGVNDLIIKYPKEYKATQERCFPDKVRKKLSSGFVFVPLVAIVTVVYRLRLRQTRSVNIL